MTRWPRAAMICLIAWLCGLGVHQAVAAPPTLDLLFVYGSEKKDWLEKVTKPFNDAAYLSSDGRVIRVVLQAMGSGELAKLLKENGAVQPHLASPASSLHLELVGGDVVGPTRSLVKSPVVIAMWDDKAKAMGWPAKPLGWQEVLTLARDNRGFKFGHTHPEHSNSGLVAVVAQVYAATGKFEGLTAADAGSPASSAMLAGIGRSIVNYGSSTGTMGKRMSEDEGRLDAAVLYENMVIEHNKKKPVKRKMVAVYPSEGTFMSDHPVGIVQRNWVTPAHAAAAEVYIKYLLDRPQQLEAMTAGFRPGVPEIPIATPIDAAFGVDPAQPAKELKVPPTEVIRQSLDSWRSAKKPANVVLAIDVSDSMKGEKMIKAIEGAKQFVDLLGEKDKLSIIAFNSYLKWWTIKDGTDGWTEIERDTRPVAMGDKGAREKAKAALDQLKPEWQTRLHEAVLASQAHLVAGAAPGAGQREISCIIVLSDGKDYNSLPNAAKIPIPTVVQTIKTVALNNPIIIFTIGYGVELPNKQVDKSDLDETALKEIAAAGGGSYELRTPGNLKKVLDELSTYFTSQAAGGNAPR